MNTTLAAFALLIASPSMASEFVIDGAVGVFHSGEKGLSESKMLKLGLEEPVWNALKQRFNVCMWLDNGGEGKTNSACVGYQLGFEVNSNDLTASIWSGPGLITSPDVLLGSPFEFNETAFIGIHNVIGETIGVSYNHWSDAGLTPINIGRDYFGVEIKFGI